MNRVRITEAVAEQLMLVGVPASEAEDMAETGATVLPEYGDGQHPTDRYYPEVAALPTPAWIEEMAEMGGPEPEVTPAPVIIDVNIEGGHFVVDGVATVITHPVSRVRFFEYSPLPKL